MHDKKAAAKVPFGAFILDGDLSLPPASTLAFKQNPPKGQTKKMRAATKCPKTLQNEVKQAIPATSLQQQAGLPDSHLQYHSTPSYCFSQQSLPQLAGSPNPHPYHSMPGYNYLQPSSLQSTTYNPNQLFVWQSTLQQPSLQNHLPSSHYINSGWHRSTHPPNLGPTP